MEDNKDPESDSSAQQEPVSQQTGERPQIPRTSRPELGNLQTEAIDRIPETKKEEK